MTVTKTRYLGKSIFTKGFKTCQVNVFQSMVSKIRIVLHEYQVLILHYAINGLCNLIMNLCTQ